MSVRHLVLDLNGRATAEIACLNERVPFDQTQHTLLAALATCPACLAVQAARVVVLDAQAEGTRSWPT